MAKKMTLEKLDGGRSLTPGRTPTLEDDIAPAPKPRVGARKPVPTVTQITDAETDEALELLREPETADLERPGCEETLQRVRDKILALKANRPYWERLEYAQRVMLNGALALAKEALGDKDANGLPETMSKFLGVQFPR
jgi:hypothetical protein